MKMNDLMIYALLLSCLANIVAGFFVYRLKKTIKTRKESIELQEFLGDLLAGEAVVRVSRVNPSDIFLRSPRGR